MADTLKTRELKGVEILDVGTWEASTGTFEVTDADLDEMVANFEATKDTLKVPAKLGHDEGQRLLQQDGYPAAGWLERLYRDGTKLVGDFAKVPAKVADLVDVGGYRKVSAEIWHDVSVGSDRFARLLMGVAFLGEDAPAVTTLDDILELYGARAALTVGPSSRVQTVVLERKKAKEEQVASDPKRPRSSIRARVDDAFRRLRQIVAAAADGGVDVSHEQRRQELQDAIDERFGNSLDGSYPWVCETYDDRVIVQRGADYFAVPYQIGPNGDITFDDAVPVVQTWVPKNPGDPGELPANTPSAEGSGVSTPPQADIEATKNKEDDMADLKTIAAALGLADGASEADILAKIKEQGTTVAQLETMRGTVVELQTKDKKRDAAAAVETAIRARKLAPAQREWAQAYAEKDPEGFKAYVEKTPELFSAPRGSDHDAPETASPREAVAEKVAAAMAADPKLTFQTASEKVARENPDLAARMKSARVAVTA